MPEKSQLRGFRFRNLSRLGREADGEPQACAGFESACEAQKEREPLRNKLIASATLAVSALSVAAAPLVAEARPQPRPQRVLVCPDVKSQANTGTVVGAIAGGLLGNAVARGGGRTGGTIIGAGVGAVAGHEIAKNNAKRNCRYEWR